MSNIMDLCFLCTKDYNCVPVDHKIVTQVEYVLPEITIFSLGIPLRICSSCYDSLYSFGKFKQSSVESSRRFEADIKAQDPSLNTDNTHVANRKTYNLKHKPQHGSPTEQQMAQTSLPTDNTSTMEIFIKEEKMDETNQDQQCYNNPPQNSSQLECTKNKSEDPLSGFNKFKQTNAKSSPEMAARDPLLDTDNTEQSSTNLEKIEEVFIKEEPCENMEYYSSMLQQDYVPNSIDGSSRAETNDEEWEGSSANCEGETGKKTDTQESSATNTADLLPNKSKMRYNLVYSAFEDWLKMKDVSIINEDILLIYFSEKSQQNYKSSTLWSTYSMLKLTLLLRRNIDISKYNELIVFLKRQGEGYQAKKSRVLSRTEIDKFLREAPDEEYLMIKVVLIIGITGACRCDELTKITIDDIEDKNSLLLIRLPKRTIIVEDNANELNNITLYRKYRSLRPSSTPHRRLFVNYRNGKCSVQAVGVHTFGKIPSKVASYLGLDNPNEYTGHCLRRSSAT